MRHRGLFGTELSRVIVWHHQALPPAYIRKRSDIKTRRLDQIVSRADPRGVTSNTGDSDTSGISAFREPFDELRDLVTS